MTYKEGYDRIKWLPLPPKETKERCPSRRANFPCPRLVRDFDEPVQSMADGKYYHSKAALSASHKASGNPQGIDYVELGNETPEFKEYTPSPEQLRADVTQAHADVQSGNIPDWIKAIE